MSKNKERKYYIYFHYRNDKPGHVFYIGSGSGRRFYHKKHRNDMWYGIVNKHGYTTEIKYYGVDRNVIGKLEGKLIKAFKSVGMCEANFAIPTGAETHIHSEETKAKMSEAKKNTIHINNSIDSKMILPTELDYYRSIGYELGRLTKGKKHFKHKGSKHSNPKPKKYNNIIAYIKELDLDIESFTSIKEIVTKYKFNNSKLYECITGKINNCGVYNVELNIIYTPEEAKAFRMKGRIKLPSEKYPNLYRINWRV